MIRLLLCGLVLLGVAACGGGGIGEDDEESAHIRAVNVIADSPTVQFSVDGTAVFTADYGGVTSYNALHVRTSTVQPAVPSPSDLTGAAATYTNLGPGLSQAIAQDKDYTVFTYGTVAAPQMFIVEGTDQRSTPADNKVIWQIVHTAPSLGSVDVYLTAPSAGVSTPTLIGNLNLQQSTIAPELTLAAASGAADTDGRTVDMTIELRQAGTATVLYRSKALSVNEQNRLLFAIVDPQGPGPAQAELLSFSGTAGASATRLVDVNDNAEVRFANVSVDAPALDLRNLTTTLASGIAFGTASNYQTVPSGTVGMIGAETATPSNVLFVSNLTASAGASYTLYASGPLASIASGALTFVDDRRPVAGRASLRFLHAASSLSADAAVNVYMTLPGAGLNLGASTPPSAYVSVAYRNISAYQVLKPGNYDAYFALSGATTALLGPVTVSLAEGQKLTFALANTPGTGALGLTPFVDAQP